MLEHFSAPHLLTGHPPKTPILVALSGGADSVALLAMLREYAARYGTPLHLAHVNHGIRGEEAIRDRDFCIALADRWGLPISVLDADVPALRAADGGSMEEVARRVRYEFFERVMEEYNIPLLATAHHADDQLETMLLRLTRGTGPDGLCGIPPVRALNGGRLVIRPLLACAKADLERYCRVHELDFVVDSTNEDISYARNRIRREVIPHLRAINPSVTDAAVRLSETLRVDASLMTEQTDAFVRAAVGMRPMPGGGISVSVPCVALGELPDAIRRRVLVRMMRYAGCPQPEERFVRSLTVLARDAADGKALSLPGGVTARRLDGRLFLCRESEQTPCTEEEIALSLSTLPRRVTFGPFCLSFADGEQTEAQKTEKNPTFPENVYKMSMNAVLNSAKIKGTLILRTRRAGDRFLWHGHHHKVKKLFCDGDVPRAVRDSLPLLCDEVGIVLIPGIGVRDGMSWSAGERELTVSVTYCDPMNTSPPQADGNIRNQQKEETDEE